MKSILYLIASLIMISSASALPVMIKSYDNTHYLWADNGGGGTLQFTSLGGTTWETFAIEQQVSGRVAIKCYDNTHYVWANNGGGGTVQASSLGGTTWETFTMINLGSGKYAFKCYDGTHYLSATNGGGSSITASATSIGNYETFECSGYSTTRTLGTRITNETFIWSAYTPGGSVTVGHTGSGANYICDGTNDEVEINTALATKKTVKLITDSLYNISNSITIPGKDIVYTLTANTPGNPPTLKAAQNCVMISAPNATFNISHLNFDGNSHQVSCINFSQSCAGSRIDSCYFTGYTSSSTWTATGIYGTDQNCILVDHNTFVGANGVCIWIEGKTDANNRGAYAQVSYNVMFFNSNGDYTKGNVASIQGNHLHIDHNNIVSGAAEGITVSRSWIEYNVIRGCAESGIKPSSYPIYDIVHPNGDYGTYYTDCANNCYCLIDHNICEYCGYNGIDYWYSDGSIVTNNRCNDNGQSASPSTLWDRDGIDVNDHTQNTQVSNNECTNKASTMSDTVTGVGSNYIQVAHLNRWYDTKNGGIVPFNGLNVQIGSNSNKISSLDIAASKIYLANATTGISAGNVITGINEQTIGINVASNGMSLGNHTGAHNNVSGNLLANIEPTIDGSHLPNTTITADGTGPINPP